MTAVGSCPLLKKGKTTQTKLYSINIISPILSQFQRENLCICICIFVQIYKIFASFL